MNEIDDIRISNITKEQMGFDFNQEIEVDNKKIKSVQQNNSSSFRIES